ncbi:MAG: tRNA (guanosine(37)-N1)-methyltransferase TrmD [Candidatus Lloydbacteria bacterium RIFCSPHIGHO2_01_FULL_41_20]|uniref:tRNA (guanine-N(1)-)-methyltransferase n=1 Tax=Candidatus Lloydbacteria bacterium RIFCSPHIGHO2_01_FULL_41_20 TaxID=1798657 RepID=A0A1G2CTB8_9BACT|nr:MAG: tRNA (guanosine(37)-N1)-methyltransferase TrmD [Candidatus Lloydbacteria bacterium RIFCSPHIGHO2_01_FULL_41_20]
MNFHIITIFPKMFGSYLAGSILARAIKEKKIGVKFYNPRDFTKDKHHKVDDRAYGGGPGMVMYAEPILKAVERVKLKVKSKKLKVIILSPSGKKFTNTYARDLAKKHKNIILISGRYEGIDARVKKILKAEEVSIGDYVLTGGELPAMVIIDSVARQIKGVLGKFESLEENRVSSSIMYTRPETLIYKGNKNKVPKVLLSGHQAKINEWKKKNK